MGNSTRISRSPKIFSPYMDRTDTYQLAIVPDTRPGAPPGATVARYVLWNWTAAESAVWTGFRTRNDVQYPLYSDKMHSTTAIRRAMKQVITDTHLYDHNSKQPALSHKLLDKIAMFGTVEDCLMFGVKAGTVLSSTANTRSANPAAITYSVVVLHNINLAHILQFTRTQAGVKSHARGKGIKEIQVWRFIGTAEPADLTGFKYVGNVVRGKFISNFDAATDKKKIAWYYVVAKNTHEQLSPPSPLAHADVTAA
ncbi:MAG TPA: hypothetical protein VF411_15255 [Bacteroidia bacterium]